MPTDPGKSSEYHCERHAIHRASCPATLYLTGQHDRRIALTKPVMARAKVDLPHPDSLPHPNVTPSYRRWHHRRLLGVFGGCQNHCLPSLISKCTFRSAISRRTFLPSVTAFPLTVPSTGLKQAHADGQACKLFQRRCATANFHRMVDSVAGTGSLSVIAASLADSRMVNIVSPSASRRGTALGANR